eukprot:1156779-Pelagomonas_calceolata.AAC.5
MICAANVHGGKVCPKRTFADTLNEDSASNIVALENGLGHADSEALGIMFAFCDLVGKGYQ